jgi:hypothetical protein
MDPSPNSGQLRLPFKPVGLHSDENAPKLDTADDLPAEGTGPATIKPPSQPAIPAIPAIPATPSPPTIPTTPPTPTVPSAPSEPSTEEGQKEEQNPSKGQSIWEWFDDVFEDIKDRISKIFGDSR